MINILSFGPNFIIRANFIIHVILSGLSLIQNSSYKWISNVKSRISSLPMHAHNHQLDLLEQHS